MIPARNEERNLEQALQSVLALDYPDLEIIVVNDRSTDDTGAILEKMAERDTRLAVVTIDDLPTGWIGKPHALHVGAQQARGEFILFTDADIVFDPLAFQKAMAHVLAHQFDHVTLIPQSAMPGVFPESVLRYLRDVHVHHLQTMASPKSAEPALHGYWSVST